MIFIDTSAFVARLHDKDQHHPQAMRYWRTLDKAATRFYTSNFVLDETFTLLARRTNYLFSANCADQIYKALELTILRPSAVDELDALALFRKYADQQVSFTDCVSFALMSKVGIESAFTFDRHFQYAGFTLEPSLE